MVRNLIISDSFKKSLAEFVSAAAYAPVISIPAFAVINYYLLSFNDFILVTLLCTIFAGILPILLVLYWIESKKSNGKKIAIDIPVREERNFPLAMVIFSYLVGVIALYLINAPLITTVLMFCYFSNTLLVFFINLHWKISIHAMGVAGPVAALIYVFGPIGSVFGLIIPLVMWSRVYLGRHTYFQVISGVLLGIVSTAIQIVYFIKIPLI